MANGNVVKKNEGEPKEPVSSLAIFGTTDTNAIIVKAKSVANAVSSIVEKGRLYTTIRGKKYVWCEGWTTMGALLGLFPQITEVREERNEKGVKFISTCEIRTVSGNLISKAQSECASWEEKKKQDADYSLRSMSETRAVSKAFRISLSWIMVLSGFQPTPAEEMVDKKTGEVIEGEVEFGEPLEVEVPKETIQIDERPITEPQRKLLFAKCKERKIEQGVLKKYLIEKFKIDSTTKIIREWMDTILKDIEDM